VRVLAVTHGSDVGPELVGDVVREQGHELREWDIVTQGSPPLDVDVALVFGGAQNVGEELVHPWLHDEYGALRHWLDRDTPLLAVCLGAQTLAYATGGAVAKARQTYLGFFKTELTAAGVTDPVLGVFPPRFMALNANAYAVQLPHGAVSLARSAELEQAFRIGERAWAVQFHPEVRRDQIVGWFAEEQDPPRALDELAAEVDAGIERWQAYGRALAHAFLHVAAA
jgi:GMP synthase-like glutamine amidotransferase